MDILRVIAAAQDAGASAVQAIDIAERVMNRHAADAITPESTRRLMKEAAREARGD
jgi:hypothetical protein